MAQVLEVSPKVMDMVKTKVQEGNTNTKELHAEAMKLDKGLKDWNIQKFIAGVYRPVRRELGLEAPRGAGGSTGGTRRRRRRTAAPTSVETREMLIEYAKAAMNGNAPDTLTLFARFDPRAMQFKDILESFKETVVAAEDKMGVFDALATVDERAQEIDRLFPQD